MDRGSGWWLPQPIVPELHAVCVRGLWQCSEALRQLQPHLLALYLHKGGWMWIHSRQRDLRAVSWCTTGTGAVLCVLALAPWSAPYGGTFIGQHCSCSHSASACMPNPLSLTAHLASPTPYMAVAPLTPMPRSCGTESVSSVTGPLGRLLCGGGRG